MVFWVKSRGKMGLMTSAVYFAANAEYSLVVQKSTSCTKFQLIDFVLLPQKRKWQRLYSVAIIHRTIALSPWFTLMVSAMGQL